MTRIALLGAGKMGEALLTGLVKSGQPSEGLCFTERSDERARQVAERHGVRRLEVPEAVRRSDVLVVAVKPHDAADLLAELRPEVGAGVLVVSLCAGLPTEFFERRLPEGTAVVRVMPNTPMLVGEAMSVISAGRWATDRHLDQVTAVLASVGRVARVPESQQDAVTAVSGSGPAYFYYLAEAMADAGVLLGLPRPLAAELAAQTALGAARMLTETGDHPVVLREAVTSPGGTTAVAVHELDRHAVKAAITSAIEKCRDRSVELGRSHAE
ncbi:MAG TPA: pyrroline-5-carboxylate reductase [Pseudonocardia sp.]|jgi:pyrroline-5-carboxylate reductase